MVQPERKLNCSEQVRFIRRSFECIYFANKYFLIDKDGQLRMYLTADNRTLLPVSTDPMDGCNVVEKNAQGKYCFESGDTRANENLHLTSMHLIWARHHNYLAQGLQTMNPHWNDENIFQEGRRILSAQLQHITYNEFLTVLLGTSLNFANNLKVIFKML